MRDNNKYYYKENEKCLKGYRGHLAMAGREIVVDSYTCEFCHRFNGHGVDENGEFIYCEYKLTDVNEKQPIIKKTF